MMTLHYRVFIDGPLDGDLHVDGNSYAEGDGYTEGDLVYKQTLMDPHTEVYGLDGLMWVYEVERVDGCIVFLRFKERQAFTHPSRSAPERGT